MKPGEQAGFAYEDTSMDTRRTAQGLSFVLSVALILLAAGPAIVQRPVGLAFVALWVAMAASTAALRRPGTSGAYDRRQRKSVVALGVVGFLVLLVAGPWEYTHLSGPIPRDGLLAWIGVTLFAGGTLLYAWSMWALRGAFTIRLSVQPSQRLVTSGPYRLVRHPGYFGFVLVLPGMGFALGSLAILAFVPPILVWLLARIRDEETMLVAEFGAAYREYQARTKRLIPFVY